MINNTAIANEMTTDSGGMNQANLMSFLPFIMIFVIFYFMLIRPQMKKQKEQQNMLNSLKKGEKIITASGIIGSIVKIEDDNTTVIVEIAPEIKIKMLIFSYC